MEEKILYIAEIPYETGKIQILTVSTNLHLNNGYTIPDCRDSAPFFRKICMNR